MAHVEKVKVRGLAGKTRPLECTFNRDINVFFGLNGSGKTSLLRIIHSAMFNDSDLIDDVHFESAEVTIYSADYDKTFVRKLDRKSISRSGTVMRSSKQFKLIEELEYEDVYKILDEDVVRGWVTSPSSPKDAKKMRWRHKCQAQERWSTHAVRVSGC